MQDHWCYPIERCLKTLRKKCRNKAKIEASIAEAYILEEVSNFIEKYYTEKLPSVYNPPPRYNASENESNLSLFQGQLGSASASTTKQLKNEECHSIMLYVDQPYRGAAVHWVSSERTCFISPYVLVSSSNPLVSRWYREFLCQSWHGSRQPTPQENDTLLSRGAGPECPNFICWFK